MESLSKKIASAWITCSPRLQKCHTCEVHVYRQDGPTGFAISSKGINELKDEMDDWVKIIAFQLKQMSEAAKMPKKWVASSMMS
jgi:hypothetical protein